MATTFFFNDTATTEIYTLSLHDALPILGGVGDVSIALELQTHHHARAIVGIELEFRDVADQQALEAHLRLLGQRSEEHTSELQSPVHLVCRLLLEKKKKNNNPRDSPPPH